jgi:uncharacterized protein (TIGR04141 family)
LLIRSEGKIFAITFGLGRYLLQSDCWIERFGLIVALNSIGKDKIRTIDKRTFDAISRHSREQASKEVEARDFGLDIEQDLLRAITGIPKNPKIGKRIYGMDCLNLSTDIPIDRINDLLPRIYDKFIDDSYKKDFPWVDHISEIKDKHRILDLDSEIVSKIFSGNTNKIWMAVPDIIEWDQVGGFCYKISKNSPEYQDVHLQDFIDSLSNSERENLCIDTFKKRHVHCMNSEGYIMREWQAYKCLYGELEQDLNTYLLSGGSWYVIAKDFVANVNQSYDEIPVYKKELPKYDDDSEGQYNKRISLEMSDQFALMHGNNILYGGTAIEFCDLLSVNKDIIHIKRYGGSNVLSHLFSQGRISGELFQMEKGFREKVAEKLPLGFEIRNPQERPHSDDYQIVYAIISDVSGDLDIPFFSKLNLKNSARSLRGLGYRVAKIKIGVDEVRAKLTKYRNKKKGKQ